MPSVGCAQADAGSTSASVTTHCRNGGHRNSIETRLYMGCFRAAVFVGNVSEIETPMSEIGTPMSEIGTAIGCPTLIARKDFAARSAPTDSFAQLSCNRGQHASSRHRRSSLLARRASRGRVLRVWPLPSRSGSERRVFSVRHDRSRSDRDVAKEAGADRARRAGPQEALWNMTAAAAVRPSRPDHRACRQPYPPVCVRGHSLDRPLLLTQACASPPRSQPPSS